MSENDTKTLESKKPGEEYTIARPIPHRGPIQLNFNHRRMYMIPNFVEQFAFVNPAPVAAGITDQWIRNQFRCLPIRSMFWWMTPGEAALLFQFQKMKFLSAKWCIHNQSFRTQFITGSSAVGYANSNMQCHGYIYRGDMDNFPIYDIWYSAEVPITDQPVNGINVANFEWPASLDEAPSCITSSPQYGFQVLPYTPWVYQGSHAPTTVS